AGRPDADVGARRPPLPPAGPGPPRPAARRVAPAGAVGTSDCSGQARLGGAYARHSSREPGGVAAGCRTLIAQGRSSFSPYHSGHPVFASIAWPFARFVANECPHGIGRERRHRRHFGDRPATGGAEEQRALGIALDLAALLVDGAVVEAA